MDTPKNQLSEVRMEAEITRDHGREDRKPTSVECVRECTATVRMMMALGWDDDTMCMEFGISQTSLSQYKRVIISKEQSTLSHRPPEELYIEHRLMIMSDVNALQEIGDKASANKNFAAATNARRARAQLLDKLFDRGQEAGVIPRAAKRHEVIGGLLVAQLSDREILAEVMSTVSATRDLIKTYGGSKAFAALPLPESIYSNDPTSPEVIELEIQPKPKRKKAKK